MLKLPSKADNKFVLIAPVLFGIYLAILYRVQGLIYGMLYLRFRINFSNEYPILTLFALFILSAPFGILINNLLTKRKASYDSALLAGLSSNYAFVVTIIFFFFMRRDDKDTIYPFLGAMFFASIFGFVVAAVAAVMYDKISYKFYKI